ncbi:MAG TPA: hypothetical protein VFP84_15750 [Kofleriaceae bacterium]|nr:hypothetical protein [Kofleriaceae bacterium]
MARASLALVHALRTTAARLAGHASYAWGHLGMCNCGHLVQTLCAIPPARIHAIALERTGDWEQLANDYCPTSGYAIDDVISALVDAGLTTDDIGHLEKLDDPAVLAALPGGHRWLRRNLRDDVVVYLQTWADLCEAALPAIARAA